MSTSNTSGHLYEPRKSNLGGLRRRDTEERIAGRDNTVRYNGLVLQIPATRDRYHFAKATIRVLEYHDGRIALFHGPRKIARFLADGSLDEGEAVRKQSVA